MAPLRNIVVVSSYACIVVAFAAYNWFGALQPPLVRWPEFAWKSDPVITRSSIDQEAVTRSIQRLPAVRQLRMLGNAVRIALGQRLEWIVWGEQKSVPVLASKIDLVISRGLADPALKANLEHLITRLGQYSRKLEEDGWNLYVVAVPTKLGIYRDYFSWPQFDSDALSAKPVDQDHSDELYSYLARRLAATNVRFVNLQEPFRELRVKEPTRWLYPPGESHWTEFGIETAATLSARKIAEEMNVQFVPNPAAPSVPYFHNGDIVRSMDTFPDLMGRYRDINLFPEVLKLWPTYAPNPNDRDAALVAVLGTSYTGHYTGNGAGFASAIGAHLLHAHIVQISQTGVGGFHPFRTFLDRKDSLAREFASASAQPVDRIKKIVVWEFPIRDFGYLTVHSEAAIQGIDNPNGVEVYQGSQLFWLGSSPAIVTLFASEDGVVECNADLQPGPALNSSLPCTLAITTDAGREISVPVVPGRNSFRLPVQAGLNRFRWRPLEPAKILPPYNNGDPRTLILRVLDLKLVYRPGVTFESQ